MKTANSVCGRAAALRGRVDRLADQHRRVDAGPLADQHQAERDGEPACAAPGRASAAPGGPDRPSSCQKLNFGGVGAASAAAPGHAAAVGAGHAAPTPASKISVVCSPPPGVIQSTRQAPPCALRGERRAGRAASARRSAAEKRTSPRGTDQLEVVRTGAQRLQRQRRSGRSGRRRPGCARRRPPAEPRSRRRARRRTPSRRPCCRSRAPGRPGCAGRGVSTSAPPPTRRRAIGARARRTGSPSPAPPARRPTSRGRRAAAGRTPGSSGARARDDRRWRTAAAAPGLVSRTAAPGAARPTSCDAPVRSEFAPVSSGAAWYCRSLEAAASSRCAGRVSGAAGCRRRSSARATKARATTWRLATGGAPSDILTRKSSHAAARQGALFF